MSKYITYALMVALAAAWGAYKWQGYRTADANAKLAAAIEAKGKLISELKKSAGYTNTLKLSLEMQAEDAEVQARAADEARKKERLAWIRLNKLQKDLANVPTSENVPVSPHIERVLDELRSPVAGNAGADSSDGRDDAETSGPLGPVVSPETDAPAETPVS